MCVKKPWRGGEFSRRACRKNQIMSLRFYPRGSSGSRVAQPWMLCGQVAQHESNDSARLSLRKPLASAFSLSQVLSQLSLAGISLQAHLKFGTLALRPDHDATFTSRDATRKHHVLGAFLRSIGLPRALDVR